MTAARIDRASNFAFSITLALVGLFNLVAAEAQQAPKVARIGYLTGNLGSYSPPAGSLPSSTA